MDVAKVAPRKRRAQRLGVELGVMARARNRPDVHQDRDVGGEKEATELVQRPRRVADGVEPDASPAIRRVERGHWLARCRAATLWGGRWQLRRFPPRGIYAA